MIERDLYKQIEPVLFSPEAVVITGMRRVGKTTLLRYLEERIASKNTLFL
jgi:predicted AAA+ superfamily ATPase